MPQNKTDRSSGKVKISFVYLRQPGMASNQFAVWIENNSGKFIKTLYATRFTAKGGWKIRPESLPQWVEVAQVDSLSNGEIDAITGATPPAGDLTYFWDCKDNNGNLVPAGEYRYFVEGSVRWKSRVFYTGTIEVGGSVQKSTAVREVHGSDEEEWNMITNVVAEYYP